MKKNKGIAGYLIVLAVILLIAVLLNGGLGETNNKRIEYPQLLNMIEAGKVKRVAIRNNSLVGITTDTQIIDADFPERSYDFETTIGADFIETVRQMEAAKQKNLPDAKSLEDISVKPQDSLELFLTGIKVES